MSVEKKYDLEERTKVFAKEAGKLLLQVLKNVVVFEDVKQLVRSSGSVGANYIEAQEPISEKDAFLRIRICRKEAKESAYWLDVHNFDAHLEKTRIELFKEAVELTKIFGSITNKLKYKANL